MTTPTDPAPAVLRPGADSRAKLAARVADRIIQDVVAMGWPVGHVLGSEADLLVRYQVSRAVFREAVRLLEHQQVARTRRGPGGGLVVTEPTITAVTEAVVLYLYRVDAHLDEILEARFVLEELAAQLAAERTNELELEELRRFAAGDPVEPARDDREFHALVAAASDNAGLELFVDVFDHVVQLYSCDQKKFEWAGGQEAVRAHAEIAEAVMAGDAGLARQRMCAHLQAEAEFFRRRRSTRQLLPDTVVLGEYGRGKGAETVAHHITGTIVAEDLKPGTLVGTEPELIAREGVSRALLREAVRLLEHHHVAQMRRGPGGGLFVMAPSTDAVSEIVAISLARRGMRLGELAELRTGVEVAIAGLASERIDAAGAAGLQDALSREENATDAEPVETEHGLHAAIAAAAQNRALTLVTLVLIRLSRLHQSERLAAKTRRQMQTEVLRTHAGIAEAVEAGDEGSARHRMQRHLEALGARMR